MLRVPRTRLAGGAEFDLIGRFLEGAADAADVIVGPGDDCAVIAPDLAVSGDLSIEDVHFRRDWLSPEEIGYRAAAAALSDLAAMAADPIGAVVAVAAPAGDVPDTVELVMRGVRDAVERCGGALIGGDVSRSGGPLMLDVVVLGRAASPVLRSGAAAGDELWVTGGLGGAAAAVAAWQWGEEPSAEARMAFARPKPRLREARWLLERGLPAAMLDLSDGLAGDAAQLAAASGLRVILEAERVPAHAAAMAAASSPEDTLWLALGGGEDYELAFAARPGEVARHEAAFEAEFGLPLTRVGRFEAGQGVGLESEGRDTPLPRGYRHFQAGGDA